MTPRPPSATSRASVRAYALVRPRPTTPIGKGIDGGPLVFARAGGAVVVIERGATAAPPSADSIRAHDRIVRRIAKATRAVLPFRFGAVLPDLDALRRSLEPARLSLASALDAVTDCEQFTLRVASVAGGADEPLWTAKPAAGPGTRWLDERARALRVAEIAEVTKATEGYVRETRIVRHDRAPLVASVYHLVPKAVRSRYRAAFASACEALEGVDVVLSGPFPPYAFTGMATS